MGERPPLLPALLAGVVGALLIGVIGATILCGGKGCAAQDAPSAEPAAIQPILPPRCITMPDGARLCDAPPSTHKSEDGS